VCACGVVFC